MVDLGIIDFFTLITGHLAISQASLGQSGGRQNRLAFNADYGFSQVQASTARDQYVPEIPFFTPQVFPPIKSAV